MLKLSKKVVFKEVDDQIVLIHLDSGFYYSLNETASFILQLIQQEKDKDEIVASLCDEYDVSEGQARQDLDECLESLRQEEILADSE